MVITELKIKNEIGQVGEGAWCKGNKNERIALRNFVEEGLLVDSAVTKGKKYKKRVKKKQFELFERKMAT